ncbi:MAG TPA: SUMF1/EgtB/PvdO family nonheme iron enzyme [Thermoanaerobaculia bacterium]|jgi:formylglycine-generating enzyme required for sulfatase activity
MVLANSCRVSRSCDLVAIPSSRFWMGDRQGDGFEQERPAHEVFLDSFEIGRFCVTAGDYFELVAGDPGFQEKWCDYINPCFIVKGPAGYRLCEDADDYPMIQVNAAGAMAYCNWVSRQWGLEAVYDLKRLDGDLDRNGFRLPTEAEWELACGGGGRSPGDGFDPSLHNHRGYRGGAEGLRASVRKIGGFCVYPWSPMPVGSLPANELGLHEMLGNVCEWCHDRYTPYTAAVAARPRGGAGGSFRVVRGGSFMDGPEKLRTTFRYAINQGTKCMIYGFRMARSL